MTCSPRLRALLEARAPLAVLTGAGVSAESGLATFRGPGGIWEGQDAASLATPSAFAHDPETVWRFYAWRRGCAAQAQPNPAHLALCALERRGGDFTLVTQNVDGLHERAGSRQLIRLHGSLWRSRCTGDGEEFDDARSTFETLPPRCACGALLRPAVVWFGEPLPADALAAAERAVHEAALLLVVGTSAQVHPAAALPAAARAAGAYVVEINPQPALGAVAHEQLVGAAGAILPALAELPA